MYSFLSIYLFSVYLPHFHIELSRINHIGFSIKYHYISCKLNDNHIAESKLYYFYSVYCYIYTMYNISEVVKIHGSLRTKIRKLSMDPVEVQYIIHRLIIDWPLPPIQSTLLPFLPLGLVSSLPPFCTIYVIQKIQINMAVLIWYLVKSDSFVRYCTVAHTGQVTRPCITDHPVELAIFNAQ